jgi:hypothetical protein
MFLIKKNWTMDNVQKANYCVYPVSSPQLAAESSFVGFEVLTAVVMKSTIFWDITQCSPLKVNRFRRNMSRLSSGSKNKPSKISVSSAACYLLHAGFLLGLFFEPEDGGDIFLRKVG